MTQFNYSALKENRIIVTGRVEAPDAATARKKIRQMGLLPTSVSEEQAAKKIKSKDLAISALSLREKIDFTSTLEILTSTRPVTIILFSFRAE